MKTYLNNTAHVGRGLRWVGILLAILMVSPAQGEDWRNNYWLGEMYFNELATSCDDVNWARAPDNVFYAWNAYLPWMGSGIWINGNRYKEDHFASRFVGRLEVLAGEEGNYSFRLRTADMGRLYIDGNLIIDADQTAEYSYEEGSVVLTPGMHDIEVQHLEITGSDYVLLWWSYPPPPPEPPVEGEDPAPWPPAPIWEYPPRAQMWYDHARIPQRAGGAKNYYLQMDGDDTNDGLSRGTTRAWQTLAHACAQLLDGDRLYISKGTYIGPIEVNASGSYNSHIHILGDQGASGIYDVVDADDVVITAPGTVFRVDGQNMQYLRYLTLDGQGHAEPVVDITGGGDTLIYNSKIVNGGAGGLVHAENGAYVRLYFTDLDTSTGNGINLDTDAMAYHDWASIQNIDGAVIHSDGYYCRSWSYWNTIENCANGFVSLEGYIWPRFSLIKDIPGIVFRNEAASQYIYANQNTIVNVGTVAQNNGANRIYLLTSIMSGTTGPVGEKTAGYLTIENNLFHNITGPAFVGQADHISNFTADPMFVSGVDFHLQDGSPAIDQFRYHGGSTTLDLDRTTRPQGYRVDLGAYEGSAPPAPTIADLPYSTDFNAGVDEHWNMKDNYVVEAFGPTAGWHGRGNNTNEELTIQVNVTAGQEHVLIWDLFILDTWDKEQMQVEIDGKVVMDNMFWGTLADTKTDFAADHDALGQLNDHYGGADQLYKDCAIRWTPTGAVSTIKFRSTIGSPYWDESFAIDNVYINLFADATDRYPYFQPVTISAGLNRPSAANTDGSAGLWADLDADGDIDAIVTGLDHAQVLTNDGSGEFAATDLGLGRARNQGAIGDLDSDGDPDFVSVSDQFNSDLSVYINDGTGTMNSIGRAGADSSTTYRGLALVDMNSDGLLDVVSFSPDGNMVHLNQRTPSGGASVEFVSDEDDRVWGDLVDSGFYGQISSVASADVNGDKRPDFFYHNYSTGGNSLMLSDAEDGYAGWSIAMPGIGAGLIGASWGDYDNDGDQDLFVPDPRVGAGYHSYLFRNDGSGGLSDVSTAAGIVDGGAHKSGVWGDYDNDGDLDLFVAAAGAESCIMYRNNADGTFTNHDVNATRDDGGAILDVSMADYDNDGDLDILTTRSGNENMTLYRNRCDNDNYLKVRIVGRGWGGDNTSGIGVRVDLINPAGGIIASRQTGGARGYGGQAPGWLHFGGVDPAAAYTLRVHFRRKAVDVAVTPSAASTVIGDTTIDQMVTLDEKTLLPGGRVVRYQEISPVDE